MHARGMHAKGMHAKGKRESLLRIPIKKAAFFCAFLRRPKDPKAQETRFFEKTGFLGYRKTEWFSYRQNPVVRFPKQGQS